MRTIAFAIVAVFALAPSLAHAEITSVTWDPARSQSPTFGGLSFGSVGQYESCAVPQRVCSTRTTRATG